MNVIEILAVVGLIIQPAPTVSRDLQHRRLLDRLTRPVNVDSVAAPRNLSGEETTPTRDRTTDELFAMLSTASYVRLPPADDPPTSVRPPWHHPAVTHLAERARSDAGVLQSLAPLTRDQNPDVRFHAALALAELDIDAGIAELNRVFTDLNQPLPARTLAGHGLARFADRLDPRAMEKMLDPWVGPGANDVRIPEDTVPLVSAISWCWVRAATQDPTFDPTESVVVARLSRLGNPSLRRIAALAFLAGIWNDIPHPLSPLLRDTEPTVRQSALAALTAKGGTAGRSICLDMTRDHDYRVATFAIRQLSRYPNAETSTVVDRLATHASAAIREAAADVAGDLRLEAVVLSLTHDPQSSVRIQAARSLGRLPSANSQQALRRMISDDRSPTVQQAAIDAVAGHPPADGVPILIAALESQAVATRQAAADRLAAILPEAREFPTFDSPERRSEFAARLTEQWNQRSQAFPTRPAPSTSAVTDKAVQQLVDAWLTSDPARQASIASQIIQLSPSHLNAVEDFFLNRDVAPPSDFQRTVLSVLDPTYADLQKLTSAARPGEAEVSSLVARIEHRSLTRLQGVLLMGYLLQSNDADTYRRLVPLLRRDFGTLVSRENIDPRAGDELLVAGLRRVNQSGLHHPDDAIRVATCLALAEQPDPSLAPDVAELMNDPQQRVRRAAIQAAGATGEGDVTESLIQALSSPLPEIQVEAAGQLLKQGNAAGFDTCRRLFASPDPKIRQRVVEALGLNPHIDREATLQLLTRALADPKMEVQREAVESLESVVGAEMVQAGLDTQPLGEKVNQWKRTMASYFAKPEDDERMRQLEQIQKAQEKMRILPFAN